MLPGMGFGRFGSLSHGVADNEVVNIAEQNFQVRLKSGCESFAATMIKVSRQILSPPTPPVQSGGFFF